MNAFSNSMLSGFDMKSPSRRLSIRAELFKNFARLRGRGSSGSLYISLCSSRNARPVLGLVLKRVVPVRISFFKDFVFCKASIGGNVCG